jgi:hypothetical protein
MALSASAMKSTSAERSTSPGDVKGEQGAWERMPRRVLVGIVERGP